MKILVTGSAGYIGFPVFYELRKLGHEVIGVDNNSRQEWVDRSGGKSHNYYHATYIYGDLTNQAFVNELVAIHKPDAIIHLASQPSMPYSQINAERAFFTQQNNTAMCLNILWAIKDLPTKLIITTTTGIPGQCYEVVPEDRTINAAGSWYHVSRGFDSANCNLAARQWNQQTIELRTSIVYGVQTNLMRLHGIATRFDTDPYFGTALNRFVQQALDGKPITIYGKGEQTKPFIALEDCVRSIIKAIDWDPQPNHQIFNQTTQCVSINRLAKAIELATPVKVSHIPNPRIENESFQMYFNNGDFLKLLREKPVMLEDEILHIIYYLKNKGSACEEKSITR